MAFSAAFVSGSLGGSLLALGGRSVVAVTVPGARAGMNVRVTPNVDPGAGFWWDAWVSANDTVIVAINSVIAGTPTATTYAGIVEQ